MLVEVNRSVAVRQYDGLKPRSASSRSREQLYTTEVPTATSSPPDPTPNTEVNPFPTPFFNTSGEYLFFKTWNSTQNATEAPFTTDFSTSYNNSFNNNWNFYNNFTDVETDLEDLINKTEEFAKKGIVGSEFGPENVEDNEDWTDRFGPNLNQLKKDNNQLKLDLEREKERVQKGTSFPQGFKTNVEINPHISSNYDSSYKNSFTGSVDSGDWE